MDWPEIYERLIRRPERPDARAWAALGERVGAWTRDAEVAEETCAEVWRTLNLARGGASFEGFVQGRFVGVLRRGKPGLTSPPDPLSGAERGSQTGVESVHSESEDGEEDEGKQLGARAARLAKGLEELRVRNPLHHRALLLLYEDRATVTDAADALGVDAWTVRSLAARAKAALAQGLERGARKRDARADGDDRERPDGQTRGAGTSGRATEARRASGKPGQGGGAKRAGGKTVGQKKGRPPRGGGRPR